MNPDIRRRGSRYRLWRRRLAPWRRLMPLFGFLAGVASFALVERGEVLAQWLAGLLIASWMLLVFEPLIARLWARYAGHPLPPMVVRFGTQAVHQESLFFVLPFFWRTTNWDTPQALFTILLGAAALLSVIDPLYFDRLATRRRAYLAFHGFAMFVGMLTAGPIVWKLTTTQSLQLALGAAGVAALSGVPVGKFGRRIHVHGLTVLGISAVLLAVWFGRASVPPATLWVTQASVATRLHERQPVDSLASIEQERLHQQGLYAFAAIRAPRGLRESVFHEWRRNGELVDRIEMTIHGGREAGYRAWSHKQHFPQDATGRWEVRVLTGGGQLISRLRFSVR